MRVRVRVRVRVKVRVRVRGRVRVRVIVGLGLGLGFGLGLGLGFGLLGADVLLDPRGRVALRLRRAEGDIQVSVAVDGHQHDLDPGEARGQRHVEPGLG